MSARIYIEGGGDSKELHARCREAFRRILERCGFEGRMPRLVACGSRGATWDDFSIAHRHAAPGAYIAMLIDSETPLSDMERTWPHLVAHDGWTPPHGAVDEQVLFMTTCTETWIVCDLEMLRRHYGTCLQQSALPAHSNLESRPREAVQGALFSATRTCQTPYSKGKQAFHLVSKLTPAVLRQHLPSFARVERILRERL